MKERSCIYSHILKSGVWSSEEILLIRFSYYHMIASTPFWHKNYFQRLIYILPLKGSICKEIRIHFFQNEEQDTYS